MIDTHAHLNFKDFDRDYAEVIGHSFDSGLKGMINVGSDFVTSKRAVEIASEYEKVYATVGLHPIHVNDLSLRGGPMFCRTGFAIPFPYDLFKKLAQDDKVKAIGETGLDYYRFKIYDLRFKKHEMQKIKLLQKKIFEEHLKLAQELDLPLILHCRGEKNNPSEAYKDMIKILKHYHITEYSSGDHKGGYRNLKGVIHCFQASSEIVQEFLKLGFYIGFTGLITFPKINSELLEVVKKVPLNRILLETDCPFLAPVPYQGERCEPWYVKFIAEKIGEIKKVPFEEIVKQITKNALDLFKIKY